MLAILNDTLDSSCAFLQFCWYMEDNSIPCKTFTFGKFEETFEKMYSEEETYISFGMKHPLMNEKENFLFLSNSENTSGMACKHISHQSTSLSKMFYKFALKDGKSEIYTEPRKILVALVDDVISEKNSSDDSLSLKYLFYANDGNWDVSRVSKFVKRFYDGFDEFNMAEHTIIGNCKTSVKKYIHDLKFFEGTFNVDKKSENVIQLGSCVSSLNYDECYYYMFDQMNSDVAMIFNPKTGRLSFKKNPVTNFLRDEMNCLDICEQFCTEVRGNIKNCSGIPTKKFQTFSKNLEEFVF